ncbi:MAG: anti-sigma factor antagonist [Eubacteriales bacterium]
MKTENSLFSYKKSEDRLEVGLIGEIDHHSAVRVRREIDELIFSERPKTLVLDLSRVGFMDSSGLGLIMGRYSLIKELGGVLLLRSPTQAVMKILTLAGMERMIKIEKDREGVTNEEN